MSLAPPAQTQRPPEFALPPLGPDPSGPDGDDEGSLRVRSVWISDLHLGTPGCQAQALLDFLREVRCEHLFLVGDIVDGWRLRRSSLRIGQSTLS